MPDEQHERSEHMSEVIIMPQIGQDVTTGKIVEWFKKENDPVQKGEIVCSVEGDKGIFEVEADEAGVLLKILHQVGEERNHRIDR